MLILDWKAFLLAYPICDGSTLPNQVAQGSNQVAMGKQSSANDMPVYEQTFDWTSVWEPSIVQKN